MSWYKFQKACPRFRWMFWHKFWRKVKDAEVLIQPTGKDRELFLKWDVLLIITSYLKWDVLIITSSLKWDVLLIITSYLKWDVLLIITSYLKWDVLS